MKLAQPLALIITASGSSSFVIPSALANFHIAGVSDPLGVDQKFVACSSSTYTCDCFQKGIGAADVFVDSGVVPKSLPGTFSINPGLCGSPQLDFYEGTRDFYYHGRDGTVEGTCYSNTATMLCSSDSNNMNDAIKVDDQLICYSTICA